MYKQVITLDHLGLGRQIKRVYVKLFHVAKMRIKNMDPKLFKKSDFKNEYRRNKILDEIYKKFDSFECKGMCYSTCGKVAFNNTEYKKLNAPKHSFNDFFEFKQDLEKSDVYHNLAPGKVLPKSMQCWYLDKSGTLCTIRNQRPFSCRVFGAVDTPRLKCLHGCKPTVSEAEYLQYLEVYARITQGDGTPMYIDEGKQV